ncbi:hypothetical protein QJS10_CPB20g00882 [Acorus calamus]|uniref:Uncharacterized protein n=1 Tax=Acorus calamus TaxID=4465 RepID=A0AAV9CCF9_ACOCL|nr:hypothetical protein QJS10_CPB20g00882 [Acorus calamus]
MQVEESMRSGQRWAMCSMEKALVTRAYRKSRRGECRCIKSPPPTCIFFISEHNVHLTPNDRGLENEEMFGEESDEGFDDPMEAFYHFFDKEGQPEPDHGDLVHEEPFHCEPVFEGPIHEATEQDIPVHGETVHEEPHHEEPVHDPVDIEIPVGCAVSTRVRVWGFFGDSDRMRALAGLVGSSSRKGEGCVDPG